MPRKNLILTALTACIACAMLLTVPSANAYRDGYDCTHDYDLRRTAQYLQSGMIIYKNYFMDEAEDKYQACLRDLEGVEDLGTRHTISTRCTEEIMWDLKHTHKKLDRLQARAERKVRRCHPLFGPLVALGYNAKGDIARTAAEYRDLLDDAVEPGR